jgi:tetratricopeptide (TPR) repeat protein
MEIQIEHLLKALDGAVVDEALRTFAPSGAIDALDRSKQADLLSMIAELMSRDGLGYVTSVLLMEVQRLDADGGPYLKGGLIAQATSPEQRYSMLLGATLPLLEQDKTSLSSLALLTELVIEQPTKQPLLFMHLGDIYLQRGVDRAIARYQYEQAVTHGVDQAIFHLAGLALERGEEDEALALVARAIDKTGANVQSYHDTFVAMGFLHGALALLLHLDREGLADCSSQLAEIHARMENYDEAIRIYEQAIAKGDATHHHNIAAIHERQGDVDAAIERFERGLEHGVPESAVALAKHYLQRDEPELAAKRLVAFVELREDHERVMFDLDPRVVPPFIAELRKAIRRAPKRTVLRRAMIDAVSDDDSVDRETKLLVKNCGLAQAPTLIALHIERERSRAASNLCAKVFADDSLPDQVQVHARASFAYLESIKAKPSDQEIETQLDLALTSLGEDGEKVSLKELAQLLSEQGAQRVAAFVTGRIPSEPSAREQFWGMMRSLLTGG